MKNEIPSIIEATKLTFIRLGEMEEINMTVDIKNRTMTFQRLTFNEDDQDWEADEVYASEIEDELAEYIFILGNDNSQRIREMKSMFSHKMFA